MCTTATYNLKRHNIKIVLCVLNCLPCNSINEYICIVKVQYLQAAIKEKCLKGLTLRESKVRIQKVLYIGKTLAL